MKTYTVKASYVDITGRVLPMRYAEDRWALVLEDPEDGERETLSVNLAGYDFRQPEGHVFVKTYSEHHGLPEAIEASGLATKVGEPVTFGPYDASAWLMKLSDEAVAVFEEARR